VFFVNFSSNGLILQLSQEDQDRMQLICQPVALTEGQSLCLAQSEDADHVYFLADACVSLWVQPEQKSQLAISLIGHEGAVGLGRALGQQPSHLRFEVERSGSAWRAHSQELQQLLRKQPAMLWVIARYLWQMTHDIANTAASVQYDDVQTRLAAWLYLFAQRSNSLKLNLTHEQLARMLGVRRVSVTLAAVALKDMGLLNYKRGSVDILDLAALSQQAQAKPHKST
jgi:CRP-like cAMP-binding protein